MTDSEHIYTPQDDSLAERIRAYCAVRDAWLNVEASLKHLDDDQWADTLGDREEVEQVYKITARSLNMATQAISQNELHQAREQGFLIVDEVREFIQNKRQQEMKSFRDDQYEAHSSSDRHK